ncbi:MAG: sigma-70 family RNA polymerase sigma factor [Chloroflexi bacterium]|nr:sigma-70 family RNA polymerase sigma factor [Chloroflexota bacterium]
MTHSSTLTKDVETQDREAEEIEVPVCRSDGSTDALPLEDLLSRYEPLVLRVAASFRVQVRAGVVDEDDLRQEARAQMIGLLREYQPRLNSNLEAYLHTKLRWRIANYLRAERRRNRLAVPLNEDTMQHPAVELETRLHAGLEHPRLGNALRRLSPRQRAVIARFYGHEQSVRQIAGALGVTPQAVTALRRRAEAALREELEER